MEKRKLPDFKYEKKYWKKGFKYVAGVDEVGRGCFAGPIVTGCVVFAGPAGSFVSRPSSSAQKPAVTRRDSLRFRHPLINDSKQMTPKQREIADEWIRKNALAFGIGQASVAQINRLGIKKASEIAFRKAIKSCGHVDYLLIDAFFIPYVKGLRRKKQQAIIKGDTKSVSIAAASIIAKVYRDRLMTSLSKQSKFKKYKWGQNKGYGTLEHRKAIKKYGITRQHRKAFVATWLRNLKSKISNVKTTTQI